MNHSTLGDYLVRMRLHAVLFPETAYRLEGFTINPKNKDPAPIVSQPHVEVDTTRPLVSKGETDDLMAAIGFAPVQLLHEGIRDDGYFAYFHPVTGLVAHDLHDENVVRIPETDDLAVIDPYLSLARLGTWAALKLAEVGFPAPPDDPWDAAPRRADPALNLLPGRIRLLHLPRFHFPMAFDQKTRNLLQRTVAACRDLLAGPLSRPEEGEFMQKLQKIHGINPDGTATPIETPGTLAHLSDGDMQIARLLHNRLDHLAAGLVAGGMTLAVARREAVSRLAREQAFTVLNRLAALRMAEEREIVLECVRRGPSSEGFELFQQTAGGALGDIYESHRAYLFLLFDELSTDLGVLIDRWDPAGLFPRREAFEAVLAELDAVGKANKNGGFTPEQFAAIWAQDETIGWIYQY